MRKNQMALSGIELIQSQSYPDFFGNIAYTDKIYSLSPDCYICYIMIITAIYHISLSIFIIPDYIDALYGIPMLSFQN